MTAQQAFSQPLAVFGIWKNYLKQEQARGQKRTAAALFESLPQVA